MYIVKEQHSGRANIFCSFCLIMITTAAMQVKIGMEISNKHTYMLQVKYCCKQTITEMATTRNSVLFNFPNRKSLHED